MRCWTDGNRSAFWKNGRLDWVCGNEVLSFDGFDKVGPYGPQGALAVHPTRDVVWVGGDRCATWRVDIATGERRRFDLAVADLCYVNGDELWAVSGFHDYTGIGTNRRVIRFKDAADAVVETLELPKPRAIRWPYGAAYRYSAPYPGDEPLSSFAEFRMTSSARGICVASTDGYIWGFPQDTEPFGWVVSPVYQGWLTAELVDEGVLTTAQHNGRTGEVVLIDHDGCWFDAFDSRWNPISPAVKVDEGYMLGWNFTSARILGEYPLHVVTEIDDFEFDYSLEDIHAAPDGATAVWVGTTERGAIRRQEYGWVIEPAGPAREPDQTFDDLTGDYADPVGDAWVEFYRLVGDLGPCEPWAWRRKYLPELPEFSPAIPDLARAEQVIAMLEAARSSDAPDVHESARKHMRWNFPWYSWSEDWFQDPRRSVYRMLVRDDAPRRPTRKQVRGLAARAIDPELSDFERFHAEICLAGDRDVDLDGLQVDEVLDAMLRDYIEEATINEQSMRVRRARLSGRLFESGIGWSAMLHLGDESILGVHCDFMRPNALTELNTGRSASVWYPAAGTLDGRAIDALGVMLEPFKDHAHRLKIDASEPGIGIDCVVNFRGILCPGIHDIDRAIALAAREVDLTGWYAGLSADGVLLSVFADDLQNPVACKNPQPHPAARRFVDRLVADEMLLLERDLDDEELRRVQWILFSGLPPEKLLKQLEDELFEMDAVDELFGTGEALSALIAEVLSGS